MWIEASIGPFPIKILVSCKWLKRKINEQDVDAFYGELCSSGANKGVIYCSSGFGVPAIEKASALGISCCRLYRNEPADLPESLSVTFLCCKSTLAVEVNPAALPDWGEATLEEVLAVAKSSIGPTESVLDVLMQRTLAEQRRVIEQAVRTMTIPQAWSCRIEICAESKDVVPLILGLRGQWQVYGARLEGQMLNGSYSFTERRFTGTQISPPVFFHDAPGPGWSLRPEPPTKIEPPTGLFILESDDPRTELIEAFGKKTIRQLVSE